MYEQCFSCREWGNDRVPIGMKPQVNVCYPCWGEIVEEAWGPKGIPLWERLQARQNEEDAKPDPQQLDIEEQIHG